MLSVTLLAMLAVAAAAEAEGAWVLWRHTTYPPTEHSSWSVIATYPHEGGGEAACLDRGERKREGDLGRAYTRVIKGGRETRSYVCLPDTEDPRKWFLSLTVFRELLVTLVYAAPAGGR